VHDTFCFHSPNQYAVNIEAIVFSACQSLEICNDPAALLFGAAMDFVVVAVLMGDKNYVGGQVVTFADAWVDIDDAPVVGGQPEAPVALIQQLWHPKITPLFFRFSPLVFIICP